MFKTKSIETIEKYDEKGNLVEKTVREEETEDDEKGNKLPSYIPIPTHYRHFGTQPTCSVEEDGCEDNSIGLVK